MQMKQWGKIKMLENSVNCSFKSTKFHDIIIVAINFPYVLKKLLKRCN